MKKILILLLFLPYLCNAESLEGFISNELILSASNLTNTLVTKPHFVSQYANGSIPIEVNNKQNFYSIPFKAIVESYDVNTGDYKINIILGDRIKYYTKNLDNLESKSARISFAQTNKNNMEFYGKAKISKKNKLIEDQTINQSPAVLFEADSYFISFKLKNSARINIELAN